MSLETTWFLEQIMSADKYPDIFCANFYFILAGFCHPPSWDSKFVYKSNCVSKQGLGETTSQRGEKVITGKDGTERNLQCIPQTQWQKFFINFSISLFIWFTCIFFLLDIKTKLLCNVIHLLVVVSTTT